MIIIITILKTLLHKQSIFSLKFSMFLGVKLCSVALTFAFSVVVCCILEGNRWWHYIRCNKRQALPAFSNKYIYYIL